MSATRVNLRSLIRDALDATTEVNISDLANELMSQIDSETRDELVQTGLVAEIERVIHLDRSKAFKPPQGAPRSMKWENVARSVQSGAVAILELKISVRGMQRAIGTLRIEDCATVAADYAALASVNSDRAARFQELTKVMKRKKVEIVADLDHALIEKIFHT